MSRYRSSDAQERPTIKINPRGGPLLHFPEVGGIQGPPRETGILIVVDSQIQDEGRRPELTE